MPILSHFLQNKTVFIYQHFSFLGQLSRYKDNSSIFVLHHLFPLVSSTILEEEKLQQKERSRMEMRRQVTVSWDSGGSDEAPPKVRHAPFDF